MNQKARDLLVQAALDGHVQIKGHLHEHNGKGDCAAGILHIGYHGSREEALLCYATCIQDIRKVFELGPNELGYIISLNDRGKDFLYIANKPSLYRGGDDGNGPAK